MGFLIRPITEGDVEGAVAVVRDTLAEYGLELGVGSETDSDVARLPGSYTTRGGRFLVAVDEAGAVVGTAGVFPLEPGVYELRKMYLRPAARGHGLGARLFEACLAFCREQGARQLVLDTRENMTEAIAFYERRGFVRDDAQKRGSRCTRGYRLDLPERGP